MNNLVLKKIGKNKWLFLILTICVFLCVVSACVLPMFESALLGRMLVMKFNTENLNSGSYSNRLTYSIPIHMNDKNQDESYYTDLVENDLMKNFKQKPAYFNKVYSSSLFSMIENNSVTNDENQNEPQKIFFAALNSYENNMKMISGRFPLPKKNSDDYIEAAISNDTAITNDFTMNRIYDISSPDKSGNLFKIKIVGIFNLYTGGVSSLNASEMMNAVFMDISDFKKLIVIKNNALQIIKWDYFLDYTSIVIDNIPSIIEENDKQILQFSHISSVGNFIPYSYNGVDTLKDYDKDKKPLTMMIVIFTVPLFLLLLYSIFFISKLVVEMDKNEISVLQSRGASKSRIISIYLTQGIFVAILPFVISPFFAKYITRVLGNTSGFLQFSKNIALNPYISPAVIFYDVAACVIVVITMLIPSMIASRTNIVSRKTGLANKFHVSFWKKFNLDYILLVITGYGYYNLNSRQKTLTAQNISSELLPVEPLTFLLLFAFIVAMGLLFIRFYPILMNFVSSIRNTAWSAPLYSSLKKVAVIKDKEQFLILFIIITMSLGIFNANAAQTINKNINDNIMYAGSADMVIIPYPEKNIPAASEKSPSLMQKPIYSTYKNLHGVHSVSIISVAKTPQIYANLQQSTSRLKMIGIDPKTYSQVVWSRSGLLDKHINHYLNILAINPDSCIISQNLADEMGLNTGDTIQVNTNDQGYGGFNLKIGAIVEIWPSLVYSQDDDDNAFLEQLIITNNNTLETRYQDVLFQVLVKTETENETSALSIKQQLSDIALPPAYIYDYRADISASENSAQRQSLNALLTFSFVIIFSVCFMGFILYWVFSIKSRVLQFGILRAMGMSPKSVYAMLVYEQFFISLSATIYSILIGGLASRILMKTILVTFNAGQQVLPFRFVSSRLDFITIYSFFFTMFIITFIAIIFLVRRIKIAQTIKLGED